MKFNYFKVAKERGTSRVAFDQASFEKTVRGNRRYMAAYWLAWAYRFQRREQWFDVRRNLWRFFEEIRKICNE